MSIRAPHTSSNLEQLVSRSLVFMVARQLVAYGAIFVGNVLLARWLTVEVYGLFAAALAFQNALIVIGDAGLGAALIQREHPPTEAELSSLFAVQLVIFGAITAVAWAGAGWLSNVAKLGPDGVSVIRALSLAFFITAFRSIPAMLLERNLRFDAIALAETVSTVLYQVVVVVMVWRGVGLMSLVFGLAVRYATDLLIVLYFHPWRPRVSWNFHLVKPYLSYGINMMGVRVLAYVKDSLPVLLLVPTLGAASAGQWNWALNYVGIPSYLHRLLYRVIFPAYSRAQNDRDQMGGLATTAIWMGTITGMLILAVLLVFAPSIVPLVYGMNWVDSIPVANWLAVNMIGGFVVSAVFPVLYAVNGQARSALRLFAIWSVISLMALVLGIVVGQLTVIAALYSLSTVICCVIVVRFIKPFAKIDLKSSFYMPVALSIVMSVLIVLIGSRVNASWMLSALALMFVLAGTLMWTGRDKIKQML